MAVAPVFAANLATLQASLRLTGANTSGDFQQVYESAVLQVRVQFNIRLGPARIAVLVALPYDDTPTTNNELLRALANLVEARWTRLVLMDLLPTLFMDASGAAQQDYNDEGAFRSTDVEDRAAERERTMAWIEEMLLVLSGEVEFGEADVDPRIFMQGPPDSLPKPGMSPWVESPPDLESLDPGTFDGNFRRFPEC